MFFCFMNFPSSNLKFSFLLCGWGNNIKYIWLRGTDLNRRPSGYEPDELPDCSTPRYTQILFLSLFSFLTLLIFSCKILFFFSDGFSYVFLSFITLKKPSLCSFLFKTL